MPYYFNLPQVDLLTRDQQRAVDETDPIALSGGPGTGKTVVNLMRHIRNYDTGRKRSLLVTYTKTLEFYLSKCAELENNEAAENVERTLSCDIDNGHDEIIIDEAQDVRISRYREFNEFFPEISYSADIAQSLYLNENEVEALVCALEELFPHNESYRLRVNFRNTKEILIFTQAVFPDIHIDYSNIETANSGNLPLVSVVGWEEADMIEKIVEIAQEYEGDTSNIGILLPTKKQVDKFYGLLRNELNCTFFHSDHEVVGGLENIHITTFKSAKGLEFDTVIIPNFDSYDWFIKNTKVKINEYYVGLTRAKTNLFLICKEELSGIDKSTYEAE